MEFDRIKWAQFKEDFKEQFGRYPSVISALFVIGLDQLPGANPSTKEEKQEVIHVGLCTLLEEENLYRFTHFDEDGWPHFKPTDKAQTTDIEKQENYLKRRIIEHYGY